MRINRYVAFASGLSRRAADTAIAEGRVLLNGQLATPGQEATASDEVTLNGKPLTPPQTQTVLFNKPAGYIVSRDGQGNRTIYDVLPPEMHSLKPVGRLDKDSSGVLLLTNDGGLAQRLTHPSFAKNKVYEVALNKPLRPTDRTTLEQGVKLEDGPSKLQLQLLHNDPNQWQITMHEGRNRQIRRSFEALGYSVRRLHRTAFGEYTAGALAPGQYRKIASPKA